jgi:hypothetical protein
MLTVTKRDLHKFLSDETDDLDPSLVDALRGCDIKRIIADFGMSEHHLGGDDVIGIVDGTLAAVVEGYTVVTWYGDKTEALVAGIRPSQITINE